MEIILKEFQACFLVFFVFMPLGAIFSDFLGFENKFENRTIFMKSQISHSGSGGADLGVFGPSKDIKA